MEPTSGVEPLTCRLRNNHAHSGCIFFNNIARAYRGYMRWFGHTWRKFGQQMGNRLLVSKNTIDGMSLFNLYANHVSITARASD